MVRGKGLAGLQPEFTGCIQTQRARLRKAHLHGHPKHAHEQDRDLLPDPHSEGAGCPMLRMVLAAQEPEGTWSRTASSSLQRGIMPATCPHTRSANIIANR